MTNKDAVIILEKRHDFLRDTGYGEEECAALEYAVKTIEEKRDWIPAKDKLPEKARAYLCYGSVIDKGDNHVFIAKYDATMGDFFWSEGGLDIYGYNVLAWQPLPEPYNPEEQNENPDCH